MNTIQNYRDVHDELTTEGDPDVMQHKYCMYDNVALLLDVNDSKLLCVEEMLEREYEKMDGAHEFFLTLAFFQIRRYLQGTLGTFDYGIGHGGILADNFRLASGKKFPTKALISFHGNSPDGTLAGQVIVIRDSIVDVANRLMDMNVRFALNDYPAIFDSQE